MPNSALPPYSFRNAALIQRIYTLMKNKTTNISTIPLIPTPAAYITSSYNIHVHKSKECKCQREHCEQCGKWKKITLCHIYKQFAWHYFFTILLFVAARRVHIKVIYVPPLQVLCLAIFHEPNEGTRTRQRKEQRGFDYIGFVLFFFLSVCHNNITLK